jgi:hypothetical protein
MIGRRLFWGIAPRLISGVHIAVMTNQASTLFIGSTQSHGLCGEYMIYGGVAELSVRRDVITALTTSHVW